MSAPGAEVVVCGAGVAGLSVAWQLAVRHGLEVAIVDERPPLSLTSDKSTECYRNWWPDRPMVELVNRSIELVDELAEATGNAFALNRNGYLFATATASGAAALVRQARATTGPSSDTEAGQRAWKKDTVARSASASASKGV
ncbi:MAG TPA: FAD-dependent oxidoreductase, partial [Thermoanaerobaculia bacterium]|nr:FAD-dependent oxidoreductase [Thermoanaerobaculia bacterium]